MRESKVTSIKKLDKTETVYDISVDEVEHYILESGVISHNSGLKYSGDMIVFLSKAKVKDGKIVIGNKIRCTQVKGRLTKENTQVRIGLSYEHGLSRYEGLLELGEQYGIFTKVSNKYQMPDGTKAFEKAIYKNPEKYFTQEILERLDEAAAQEFLYGNALEQTETTEEEE